MARRTSAWSVAASKIKQAYLRYKVPYVTVQTTLGPIRGLEIESAEFGYKYAQFQGVPYAKPPVGELRFKVRFKDV